MTKTMTGQLIGEKNAAGSNRPMSEIVFQLPIPPTIKPRIEDAFTRGVSSSQRDLGTNEAS